MYEFKENEHGGEYTGQGSLDQDTEESGKLTHIG